MTFCFGDNRRLSIGIEKEKQAIKVSARYVTILFFSFFFHPLSKICLEIPATMIEDMNKSFWSLFYVCSLFLSPFLIISSLFSLAWRSSRPISHPTNVRRFFTFLISATEKIPSWIFTIPNFFCCFVFDVRLALARSQTWQAHDGDLARFSQNSYTKNEFLTIRQLNQRIRAAEGNS